MLLRRKEKLLLCLSICRQVTKHFGHREIEEVLFLPVLVKHNVLFLCFGTRRKMKRLTIGILVRCANLVWFVSIFCSACLYHLSLIDATLKLLSWFAYSNNNNKKA